MTELLPLQEKAQTPEEEKKQEQANTAKKIPTFGKKTDDSRVANGISDGINQKDGRDKLPRWVDHIFLQKS